VADFTDEQRSRYREVVSLITGLINEGIDREDLFDELQVDA